MFIEDKKENQQQLIINCQADDKNLTMDGMLLGFAREKS